MASSGTTTIGSVVTLEDADDEVVLANNDISTGMGIIHWQGATSEAFISLAFGTAGSTTTTSDEDEDKDAGTTADVGLVVKVSTTGTEIGEGAAGDEV